MCCDESELHWTILRDIIGGGSDENKFGLAIILLLLKETVQAMGAGPGEVKLV